MGEKFFWEKYLNIEKVFIDAKRYVEFIPENYSVSSDFFSNEIILLGALIESSLKYLAKLRNPDCSVGNIGEIKKQILSRFPRIVLAEAHLNGTKEIFAPFSDWANGTLGWWDSYTDTKHGELEKANMKLSLTMLSALELTLYMVHSEQLKNGDIKSPNGDKANVYYSFSEVPSFMISNFRYGQLTGSGNFYFYYPISQY